MTASSAPFVLAISPSPRGFAFALFQGPERQVDWGVKEIRGADRDARVLKAVEDLFTLYQPQTLVVEETRTKESRRRLRNRALHKSIATLAERRGIVVVRYPRATVSQCFAPEGAHTRPEIATVIAKRIPAFAPLVPPVRKIWMGEDPRQSFFDAVALCLTYYTFLAKSYDLSSNA